MRKLAIAAAVSLSLSSVSHALGLGEIEMYSALNQSLDAEIEILSATEDELNNLQVRLASADAFARAGLIQLPVLSSVQFSVDRRPDGKPVVKVNSAGPVVEPFLNFLIEVDAPGNVKLVREYTVLLDPPAFASEPAPAAATFTAAEPVSTGDEGTFVDLGSSLATVETAEAITESDDLLANASGENREVYFLESVTDEDLLSSDLAETFAPADSSGNLFVPDELAIADTAPVDSNSVSLDNLGAQGDPIFENEFDAGNSQLIAGDELRSLVETVSLDGQPAATASSFIPTGNIDTDADGAGVGELLDLSGLIGPADSNTVDTAAPAPSPSSNTGGGFTELSGDTYQVQTSDTLWSISNAAKASGVTPHQMMVAVFNANRSAFIGGNINRMINGAVLNLPTEAAQRSVDRADAFAIVQSWTRGNATFVPPAPGTFSVDSAPVIEDAVIIDNDTIALADTELSGELEDFNQRLEQARTDLASETLQRDELSDRVNSLEDNVEQVEDLITLRESQLDELQNEVASAESQAAELNNQRDTLVDASGGIGDLQDKLSKDLADAQSAIERKADLDKNLATAEAEAQSIKLSSEEDALRSQLAALEIEKRDLAASSQAEKAELVRLAEVEKTTLLKEAKSERERIMAELEAEKARISREAELEVAQVRSEASAENQRVLAEARIERDRLAAESVAMQAQLAEVEAEKTRLLESAEAEAAMMEQKEAEEKARMLAEEEQRVVEERLAALQNVPDDTATDSDADGTLSGIADGGKSIAGSGKDLVSGGVDKITSLLDGGPLAQGIGDRKTVLGIGAGLSLLGLLGAWATRRRSSKKVEDERMLSPRADVRRPAPARTNFDDRKTMHGHGHEQNAPASRGAKAATAATATAAAAAAGTAALVQRDSAPEHAEPVQRTQPAQQPPVENNQPAPPVNEPMSEPVNEVELEDVALDDTITEAEVYLRYGLHGQAEDLLKTAIKRSPENEEYHFKLLENYHDQKNVDAFNDAASTFNQKFSHSDHDDRIGEMSRDLNGDDKKGASGATVATGAAVAAGAIGAGAMAKGNDAIAGVGSMLDRNKDAGDNLNTDDAESFLDQTIDPGSEFSVDELQATGDLNALSNADELGDFADPDNMALDDIDLAPLDDDGTLNLEEVAGTQMSGADLGTLDLTNTDTNFDDLTLEDAELNSLGDITGDVAGNMPGGLDSDLSVDGVAPGGSDEMETMLDLAKAYMDMGDSANAEKALKDIASRGNPMQMAEASDLLKKLT